MSETTLNVAAAPLKLTAVAPVKALPVRVTIVPTGPLAGVKELMTGKSVTVKVAALVAVPVDVVTLIFPVVAPEGTVAVI